MRAIQSPGIVRYSKVRIPSSRYATTLHSKKLMITSRMSCLRSIKKPFEYQTVFRINILLQCSINRT